MKITPIIYLFFLLTTTACFQEKEIFIPDNDLNDPAYIYNHPENRVQRFLLTVEEEAVYFKTGNNGIIKIPYGSLLTPNGQFYKGNVVMELIESDKIGDQIIHGKVAVNETDVLRTSWLLYVQFYAEGNKLTINPAVPVEWYSHIPADMAAFGLYHEVTSENNLKTWIKKSDARQQNWVVEHEGESVTGVGCVFALQDSGWYIVANPETTMPENKVELCVESDHKFTSANTIVFAIVEQQKILLPLNQSGQRSHFCHTKTKVASNSGIKFVLLSFQEDGRHYYAEKSVQATETVLPTLEPKPMPVEDIIKRIRAL